MRQPEKRSYPIPHGTPYYDLPLNMAIGTTLGSILLHFLSFCSPYWLESYPETRSTFLRVGLWSVCFDRFIHPKDNFGIEWTGCYWIFDWNLWNAASGNGSTRHGSSPYRCSAAWPSSRTASAWCASCSTSCWLATGAESSICLGTQAIAALFLLVGLIVFGVKVDDRDWMPRPDHNHLSWSFAFAVLSASSAQSAACFCILCRIATSRWRDGSTQPSLVTGRRPTLMARLRVDRLQCQQLVLSMRWHIQAATAAAVHNVTA
ncbi:hypothetical protein BOX15_Mlig023171g1 [Macrostomum lignano]|uniref:Uncharacterized protein n=1 Tax=Macrostomum lignano TaxID=282301 RepID=A0A267EP53_9PLAT|nr:hypothetical protein BOX15_Mlig023171g1 [Macrostomum lignano]